MSRKLASSDAILAAGDFEWLVPIAFRAGNAPARVTLVGRDSGRTDGSWLVPIASVLAMHQPAAISPTNTAVCVFVRHLSGGQ